MFLFLSVACLSNKSSPFQATLHKVNGICYKWLSKALLQLLVFSMQLLDFIFSGSLLIWRESLAVERDMGSHYLAFILWSMKQRTMSRLGL